MTRRILPVLVILGCSLCPGTLSAQHFPAHQELGELISSRVVELGAGGIVLGVMEADGQTTIVAYGDPGPNARALGPKSVFEIGSITKVFSATLLAEMVTQGEVALSDPVSRYLPQRVAGPTRGNREITLLDLSTHQSGLPRVPDNRVSQDRLNPFAGYTVELLYAFLSEHELRRDVGSRVEYSNLAFGLLGHALGRRVEMEYDALLNARVLTPLGMEMTGVRLEGDRLEWRVQGHDNQGRATPPWDMTALEGAGALRSNVQDMLLFLAANVSPPRTSLGTAIEKTHQIQVRMARGRGVGLAWRVEQSNNATTVFQTGGTAGFQSFAGFVAETGVAVVVLVNSGRAEGRHVAGSIGRCLLDPTLGCSK